MATIDAEWDGTKWVGDQQFSESDPPRYKKGQTVTYIFSGIERTGEVTGIWRANYTPGIYKETTVRDYYMIRAHGLGHSHWVPGPDILRGCER